MDNTAAVLAMYEALNARDLSRLDDILAPDVAFHVSHLPAPVGREAIKADMARYFSAFPDMALTVADLVVDGDRVAARIVARGTHDGTFGAMEPTGRSIDVTETDFLRMAGGKVAEAWVLYDQFTLLTQLGVLPDLATA